MADLLEIRNVSKSFGAQTAVDDVSFRIAEGEFFALLGPSGCGKTTLMRLIAGFDAPDAGQILIGGKDMTGVPPYERPVNMMFQSYALFPHMNVENNIAFGLKQLRWTKAAIAQRVEEMLRLVQLGGLNTRRPDQLSGGQRQRVALARALARRPSLLLLDEPLAALDRKLREETQFELMHVQRELGTSFLLVTHDQDEAMAMAGRMAIMRSGRIEQMGSPRDIYEIPVNRFVAGFVGDTNLIEAESDGGDESAGALTCRLRCADGVMVVRSHASLVRGARVALAVRPESIILSRTPTGELNAMTGRIEDVVFRGDGSAVRIKLASGFVLRALVAQPINAQSILARGDEVEARFSPENAQVLTT